MTGTFSLILVKSTLLAVTDPGPSSSLLPHSEHDPADQLRVSRFTQLMEESRGSLYAFIFALVPRHDAAEEILQETALYLWKEFGQFEPGSSFYHWARAVAFNRVRDYRHQQHRDTVVLFEPKLLEELATQQEELQPELEERWERFSVCMGKMRPVDQQLYKTYYTTRLTAEELAKKESRSVYAIRKSIQKIRRLLFQCVNRRTDARGEE
ncbi:MAG: RNA polymerase subunit sigma [Planctomyces sp.]|nr:RNA polymerase subunit sigma [Planctomyces sp.]